MRSSRAPKSDTDGRKKSSAYEKHKMLEFKHPEESKRSHLGRRCVHLTSSLLVLYFIMPDIMFQIGSFRMHRALFLVIIFFLWPFQMEFWRLYKGTTFFMLRKHEEDKVAAYIWTLIGAMTLCLLTEIGLPEFIAIPVMLSASLGDPLLGEIRMIQGMRRRYIYSIALLVCGFFYFIWLGDPVVALVAGFLTVISESLNVKVTWGLRKEMLYDLESRNVILRKIKSLDLSERLLHTDDNLMMQMIPLIFLVLLYLSLPELLPPNSVLFGNWPTDILSQYQLGTFFRI